MAALGVDASSLRYACELLPPLRAITCTYSGAQGTPKLRLVS